MTYLGTLNRTEQLLKLCRFLEGDIYERILQFWSPGKAVPRLSCHHGDFCVFLHFPHGEKCKCDGTTQFIAVMVQAITGQTWFTDLLQC